MRIDSHQHFWNYNQEEYGWISDEMSGLRRDFTPADLREEIGPAGIDGVISIQARQTITETQQLLMYAKDNDFIKGVVGWLPICDDNVAEYIERFTTNPMLKGLRHVVQDEPDDRFILRDDFNLGISLLRNYDLAYDILIYERHLPHTIGFVCKHPQQRFVLDHIAKPMIRAGQVQPWRKNIEKIASYDNVWCKVSGMATEADIKNWNKNQLEVYFDVVLNAFGPSRLMFGSDWPVCLCACSYREWKTIVEGFISELSESEQRAVMGLNAVEVYRL